jgi:hypothetical protein
LGRQIRRPVDPLVGRDSALPDPFDHRVEIVAFRIPLVAVEHGAGRVPCHPPSHVGRNARPLTVGDLGATERMVVQAFGVGDPERLESAA